ncbi:MAG: hypothetical protein OXU26_03835, partial [Acidobacteriota bacterium]|nr:hypothetical protein [Acidobacteriota bacterium]
KALGELQAEFESRSRWAEELSRKVEARDKALGELQAEFEDRSRWAEELSRRLQTIEEARLQLQSEFEDRTEWALRLDAELQNANAELQLARLKLEAIRNSRLYKLAKLLGLKFKV